MNTILWKIGLNEYQNRNFWDKTVFHPNCGFLFPIALICGLSGPVPASLRTFLVLLLAADCQPVLVLLLVLAPPRMAL